MTPEKSIDLACGGKLTYRLPNCLEQVRFYIESKWNSKTYLYEQIEAAIPVVKEYVTSIESEKYETLDDVLADRDNTNVFIEFCLDIAAQSVSEDKKKS